MWATSLNSQSKIKGSFILQFRLKYQSHVSIRCKSFDAVFKWIRLVRNAKYRFWLQKGVKKWIRQDFLNPHPHNVCSFICYFCLKIFFYEWYEQYESHAFNLQSIMSFSLTLYAQKLSKRKITVFGYKKGSKVYAGNFFELTTKN